MNEIKKIYLNVKHPAGFGSYTTLRRYLPKRITNEEIKKFLSSQDCYTLHAPAQRKFQRDIVYADNIDQCWHLDIAYMDKIKEENDNKRYLLVAVDVLSKMAFVRPVCNKTSETCKNALADIFLTTKRKPVSIFVDLGGEWNSKVFKSFLIQNDVKLYFAKNTETKACIAERFIKTLKMKIARYLTHVGHNRYIDVLQDIVQSYNNTYNRSIATKPSLVNERNVLDVWRQLYKGRINFVKSNAKFNKGDHVRCSKLKRTFEKGHEKNFTDEIFIVSKVYLKSPVMYEIMDLNNECIQGRFYEKELLKVTPPEFYKIDKIIRRKGKGVREELFVQWKGYPTSFNSWVKAQDIQRYK